MFLSAYFLFDRNVQRNPFSYKIFSTESLYFIRTDEWKKYMNSHFSHRILHYALYVGLLLQIRAIYERFRAMTNIFLFSFLTHTVKHSEPFIWSRAHHILFLKRVEPIFYNWLKLAEFVQSRSFIISENVNADLLCSKTYWEDHALRNLWLWDKKLCKKHILHLIISSPMHYHINLFECYPYNIKLFPPCTQCNII